MATNDFLPFATGPGANVISQAQYAALAARLSGFTAGMAVSEQLNKAWRQSSFVASVLAQFISDRTGEDVLDDGDQAKLLAQLTYAIFHGVASEAQLLAHINDHANPHQVTTDQIGAASAAALSAHVNDTSNPHQVTLAQLGAAPINDPEFTGNPRAPTPNSGDNDTSIATTAFVQAAIASGSGYTSSLGVIGWRRSPDGVIEQWGRIQSVRSEGTGPSITFPIAFPNACLNVELGEWNRTGGGTGQWDQIDCFAQITGDPSTTGFGTYIQDPGGAGNVWEGCYWRAIGH